jgi:hypothetical protein
VWCRLEALTWGPHTPREGNAMAVGVLVVLIAVFAIEVAWLAR